jgi:hypothetical protein
MRALVTGRGTAGSWSIRGEQLGRAIGAHVEAMARDVGGFDVAVLVKRPHGDLLRRLRHMAVSVVWDVVDAWPQPAGNRWCRDECMAWLRTQVQEIQPRAIVAATQAMALDCAEFGVPVLTVPHHGWELQGACVIGERVRTVGYQGGRQYLGRWDNFMHHECGRRGWMWEPDAPNVAALDLVVAVREAQGYAARRWKSNVKLANAQVCGTPFVGNREAGYLETASGAEQWADNESEMVMALDALESRAERERAQVAMLAAAPRLPVVASTYRSWLEGIVRG